MLSPGILRSLIILLCLVTAAANVQAQSSRASSATSYLDRGSEWLAKGEWDRAIADYDLAISFDAHAAAYYNRAIELNPSYADAYLNRGVIRNNQGERDVAIRDFSRV